MGYPSSMVYAVVIVSLLASQVAAEQRALAAFFRAEDATSRSKAAETIADAGGDFSVLYARLRSGRSYAPDVETGRLDWSRKGTGGRHHYVVLVPEDYHPDKRYRVCVYLHGGVNRNDGWKKGDSWWRRFDRFDGVDQISIFPSSWKKSLWWQHSQVENLAAILDRVKLTYNVDENRVFLFGVSDGGTGVYYHAMKAPTSWAAFFAFIGQPSVLSNPSTGTEGELFESNLINKPLYVVNGETDRLYPAVRVLPYVEAFREEGAEVVFRARPGGHNTRWWNGETGRLEKFMESHPRDPLPDRLSWETEDTERFGRVHWLVVDTLGDGEPAGGVFPHAKPSGRVVAERQGNRFEVVAEGVARYRLLLAPDEVDFDTPVDVVTNGVVSFHGKVEPRVETLVEWAARDNDRTMLFGAELAIEVVTE